MAEWVVEVLLVFPVWFQKPRTSWNRKLRNGYQINGAIPRKEQVLGRNSGSSAELSRSSLRHHILEISLFSISLNKQFDEN